MSAVAVRMRVESFGERLRRLRLDRGVSCAQLANRVGVTEGAIRQMESGQTKMASFVIGLRLARELGVDAWYLATGDDAEASAPDCGPSLASRIAALEARLGDLDEHARGA